jgi:hypothetical protein
MIFDNLFSSSSNQIFFQLKLFFDPKLFLTKKVKNKKPNAEVPRLVVVVIR